MVHFSDTRSGDINASKFLRFFENFQKTPRGQLGLNLANFSQFENNFDTISVSFRSTLQKVEKDT